MVIHSTERGRNDRRHFVHKDLHLRLQRFLLGVKALSLHGPSFLAFFFSTLARAAYARAGVFSYAAPRRVYHTHFAICWRLRPPVVLTALQEDVRRCEPDKGPPGTRGQPQEVPRLLPRPAHGCREPPGAGPAGPSRLQVQPHFCQAAIPAAVPPG